MNTFKPPKEQVAFTLLELIIVIIVLAILSTYVLIRSSSSDIYLQDTVIEQLISAGRFAQQLHSNDSTRTIYLSIQSNQVDLLDSTSGLPGNSISAGSFNFPLNFGSKVSLSPTTNIFFDRIGGLAAKITITVSVNGTANKDICFETSGYIRRCP